MAMCSLRGTITYDFTSYGPKTVVSATEVFAETDSDYRNYVISSTTQRLLTVLLRGLKNHIENMGTNPAGRTPDSFIQFAALFY